MKYNLYIFILLVSLWSITGCVKKSKDGGTQANNPQLKCCVTVIDSTVYPLLSTEAQLSEGTYIFPVNSTQGDILHNGSFVAGNIIVGTTGEGYIRRILSVSADKDNIIVYTAPANLEDVFQDADIAFTADFTPKYAYLYSFSFNNTNIIDQDGTTVRFNNGSIMISGKWNYTLQYKNGKLSNYAASVPSKTYMTCAAELEFVQTMRGQYDVYDTLSLTSSKYIIWVSGIPLVVAQKTLLTTNTSASFGGGTNKKVTINANANGNLDAVYATGSWLGNSSFAPTIDISTNVLSSAPTTKFTSYLTPSMRITLSGNPISTVSVPLVTYFTADRSGTASEWDITTGGYLSPVCSLFTAGIAKGVSDYSVGKPTDSFTFATPYTLTYVSGDAQRGALSSYLPMPLVVRVMNNKGKGQPNVPVYFSVTSGGGSLTYNSIFTDSSGYAGATWMLGAMTGSQTMQATAKHAGGVLLQGAPITFTAN